MSSHESNISSGDLAVTKPVNAFDHDTLFRPVSRRVATIWNMFFSYTAMILVLTRNIVLVPLFLKYIGKDEYNAWLVSGFVLMQLTNIDFGLLGVLIQRVAVAYGNRQRDQLERLIGGGLVTVIFLAVIVGALSAAVSPFVPRFIDVTPDVAHRLTMCFLVVAIANTVQLVGFATSGLLKGFQRTFLPGFFLVLSEAVALGLTVYWVMHGWGLYSIVMGLVARCVVETGGTATAFCWVTWRQFRLRPVWDRAEARSLWQLSGYQFLTQIAGRIKTSLDAFLIGVVLGKDAGGGYALTVRAHETVRMFSSGLGGAMAPAMAHLHGEGDVQRFKNVVLTLFKMQGLIAAVGFGGVIAFNNSFMHLWVGLDIFSGQAVSIVAALAGIAFLLSTPPYDAIFARGGFSIITKVVWFEVVLRFALMAVLLKMMGILGTPVASLIGQFFAMFLPLAWIIVRQLHVGRDEWIASLKAAAKLMAVPLTLATIVIVAVPLASSWMILIVEAGLFVVVCLTGTWLLDRELVRFVLRGGRGSPI